MVGPTVTVNNESVSNTSRSLSSDDSHIDQKETSFASSNVNVSNMEAVEETDQHTAQLQPQVHLQTDNNNRSHGMPNNPLLSSKSITTAEATTIYSSSSCPNPIQKAHSLQPSSPSACPALPPSLRRVLLEVAKTGRCSALFWDYHQNDSNRQTNGTKFWSGRKRPLPGSVQAPQPPPLKLKSEDNMNNDEDVKNDSNHKDVTTLLDPNSLSNQQTKDEVDSVKDNKNPQPIETANSATINNNDAPEIVKSDDSTTHDNPTKSIVDESSSSPTSDPVSSNNHSDNGVTNKSTMNPQQPEGELSACHHASYKTLREALRMAVALVLDYSYKHQGGYKINSTERKRIEKYRRDELTKHGFHHYNNHNYKQHSQEKYPSEAQTIFLERRERLLKMLTKQGDQMNSEFLSKMFPSTVLNSVKKAPSSATSKVTLAQDDLKQSTQELIKIEKNQSFPNAHSYTNNVEIKTEEKMKNLIWSNGPRGHGGYSPPFTVQRVAEVLVMPERYYTQTHKLCNALEKLLLVTCPNAAFETTQREYLPQSRTEEGGDSSISGDNRIRKNSFSQQRQRRIRRRRYSDNSGTFSIEMSDSDGYNNKTNDAVLTPENQVLESSRIPCDEGLNHDPKMFSPSSSPSIISSNEMLFQMRNNGALVSNMHEKYISMQLDSNGIGGTPQRMTDILTPTGFSNSAMPQMVSHEMNISDGMRNHLKETGSGNPRNVQENFQSSVMFNQHSVPRPPSPILFSATPAASHNLNQMVHEHHRANPVLHSNPTGMLGGHSNDLGPSNSVRMEIVIEPTSSSSPGASSSAIGNNLATVAGPDVADLDGEHGSDIDSESDDVSFDDSASDRSDGSDSCSGIAVNEPINAARVMALNRLQQQQQRRENFLQNRALAHMPSNQSNEPYRPPPDLEYQSGDSLDSMIAEDSGGSDSSSDVND